MDYNMKHISAFMLILLSALLTSCGVHSEGSSSNSERFGWALQGTWEKMNPYAWDWPVPGMIIGYRGITIIGEIEHFGNLPRNIELEGYSDTTLIYIKAREEIFPVEYKLWEAGNYPKTRMLTLKAKGLEDIDFKWVIEENE
jgi:hypothetical protein